MRLRLYSYGPSSSGLALARTIGAKYIKHRDSIYKPKQGDVIINWGNSHIPVWSGQGELWVNQPEAISIAVNKLKTLNILGDSLQEYIPKYTTNLGLASDWIHEGNIVYCRTQLQGRSGAGIVIANSVEEIVDAPLYTLKFNSTSEYRVHVVHDKVIDVVKKARREGESPDPAIKNCSKGWIFIRNYQSVIPSWVEEKCVEAVNLLGLDFGAVDVGYNKHDDTCCIFEVNTAPGMVIRSTTCSAYAQALSEVLSRGI